MKWNHLMYCQMTENEFSHEEDIALYKAVKAQDAEESSDLNFALIDNGRNTTQNKSRWRVLCKTVAGRLVLTTAEIIEKLEFAYEFAPTEVPVTILDFYRTHYPLS